MQILDYYSSELLFDSGKTSVKPTLSVCLSTYNVERTVIQALSTICNQTFDDYEIIIQDDYSSDKTCSVVLDYLLNSTEYTARRIRLYRSKQNGGILVNRLKGHAHSEGKWLIQTDGDDFSPQNRLEKTMVMINGLDHEPMLISTKSINFNDGTSYYDVYDQYTTAQELTNPPGGEWVILSDIVWQTVLCHGSSGFIINRIVFEKYYDSIPVTRIIADDPVLVRRALLIGDVYIGEIPLYFCRLSNSSASGGGVSGKQWIIDRYNRWNLLLQDIAHIREDHTVPAVILKDVEYWKRRMLLDAKLIDCSIWIWPWFWVKMIFVSRKEAVWALKKRVKLILFGSVNASFKFR